LLVSQRSIISSPFAPKIHHSLSPSPTSLKNNTLQLSTMHLPQGIKIWRVPLNQETNLTS
jgi:hypothetical protein